MSDLPMRIQRQRVKGWRMPENTKSVTRPGKYGNPFKVGGYYYKGDIAPNVRFPLLYTQALNENYTDERFTRIDTAEQALDWYRWYMNKRKLDLSDLYGRNLACFCHLCDKHKDGRPLNESCPDCDPCHVDVLGELLYGVKE